MGLLLLVSGKIRSGGLKSRLKAAASVGTWAVITSGLAAALLKRLIGRPRPRMEDIWGFVGPSLESDFHSFPSGHTSTSFALAVALARYFPGSGWLFYSLASLVGVSRVACGSHYPTDVLAGAALGLFAGNLLLKYAEKFFARKERQKFSFKEGPLEYSIYYDEEAALKTVIDGLDLLKGIRPHRRGEKKRDYGDLAKAAESRGFEVRIRPGRALLKGLRMPNHLKLYYTKPLERLSPVGLYPSKARKVVNATGFLSEKGISTPKVLAWGEAKRGLFLERSFILSEWLSSVPARDLLTGHAKEASSSLKKIAQGVASLHEAGAFHGDLNPGNVLLEGDKVFFIDLDRIKFRNKNRMGLRARDLGRLNEPGPDLPVGTFARLRFYAEYIKGNKRLESRKKAFLKKIKTYSVKKYKGWQTR